MTQIDHLHQNQSLDHSNPVLVLVLVLVLVPVKVELLMKFPQK